MLLSRQPAILFRTEREMEMGILDILSKLGILRYGVKKGVYHSGKDMPPEFLMDGVYNAERDLTTKEDLKKVVRAVKGGGGGGGGGGA